MKARILVLGVIGFVALPSCMNMQDRMSQARIQQHQAQLEATGRVATGACDDIGQYIAGDLTGTRLTLDVSTPAVTEVWPR